MVAVELRRPVAESGIGCTMSTSGQPKSRTGAKARLSSICCKCETGHYASIVLAGTSPRGGRIRQARSTRQLVTAGVCTRRNAGADRSCLVFTPNSMEVSTGLKVAAWAASTIETVDVAPRGWHPSPTGVNQSRSTSNHLRATSSGKGPYSEVCNQKWRLLQRPPAGPSMASAMTRAATPAAFP